jgi:hypothetical protein
MTRMHARERDQIASPARSKKINHPAGSRRRQPPLITSSWGRKVMSRALVVLCAPHLLIGQMIWQRLYVHVHPDFFFNSSTHAWLPEHANDGKLSARLIDWLIDLQLSNTVTAYTRVTPIDMWTSSMPLTDLCAPTDLGNNIWRVLTIWGTGNFPASWSRCWHVSYLDL